MVIKTVLKDGILKALFFSGLLDYYLQKKDEQSCFVLMLHRVVDKIDIEENLSSDSICLTTIEFDFLLNFLKNRYTIIPISQLVDKINKSQRVKNCCCITFDDGWKDNYLNAFPILKKYEVSATIFVTTGYIGTKKNFWQEKLTQILLHLVNYEKLNSNNKINKIILPNIKNAIVNKDKSKLIKHLHKQIASLKNYQNNELHEILDAAIDEFNMTNIQGRSFLSWLEIEELSKNGIEIGCHGHNHFIYTNYSYNEIENDYFTSKEILDEKGYKSAYKYFAYPNGSYNSEIVNNLKKNGAFSAFTTELQRINYNTNLMQIPRIGLHSSFFHNKSRLLKRLIV